MNPLARLQEVSVTFGSGQSEIRALREVSIEIEPGRVLGVMGPSGSGKTTLLSVLGCLLTPSGGEVEILGESIERAGRRRRAWVRRNRVGFVFQSFNLFPSLTGRQNVEVVLNYKGVRGRRARRQAYEILDSLGVPHCAGRLPGGLSGGEKQRIAIGRALAGDPPIILADEPTSNLDSESGRRILGVLRRLAMEQGRGVVIVTHDPRAEGYCDIVVQMEDGILRPRRRVVLLESKVDPLASVEEELAERFGLLEDQE
jgi:putative ABC transport system ATP-binding protein